MEFETSQANRVAYRLENEDKTTVYLEVTEWANGEGFELYDGDDITNLTWEEYKVVLELVNRLHEMRRVE